MMDMKTVAIVVPQRDFKDESLSKLTILLAKKGVGRQIAAFSAKECSGYHGAVIKPDISVWELDPVHVEALLLVNGPGFDALRIHENRQFLDVVRQFFENKRLVGGVGNSIKAIARANIIKDTKIAKLREEDSRMVRLYHGVLTDDPVVFDRNILTVSDSEDIDGAVDIIAKALGVD